MSRDLMEERIARAQASAEERATALRRLVPTLARALYDRGAHRVILFGSLATGAPPHADTDVDLCVAGLDEPTWEQVAVDLEGAARARVDLVRWEDASPRLRRRIEADGVEIEHVSR